MANLKRYNLNVPSTPQKYIDVPDNQNKKRNTAKHVPDNAPHPLRASPHNEIQHRENNKRRENIQYMPKRPHFKSQNAHLCYDNLFKNDHIIPRTTQNFQ